MIPRPAGRARLGACCWPGVVGAGIELQWTDMKDLQDTQNLFFQGLAPLRAVQLSANTDSKMSAGYESCLHDVHPLIRPSFSQRKNLTISLQDKSNTNLLVWGGNCTQVNVMRKIQLSRTHNQGKRGKEKSL